MSPLQGSVSDSPDYQGLRPSLSYAAPLGLGGVFATPWRGDHRRFLRMMSTPKGSGSGSPSYQGLRPSLSYAAPLGLVGSIRLLEDQFGSFGQSLELHLAMVAGTLRFRVQCLIEPVDCVPRLGFNWTLVVARTSTGAFRLGTRLMGRISRLGARPNRFRSGGRGRFVLHRSTLRSCCH